MGSFARISSLRRSEYRELSSERLGPFIGYMPQDVELFGGTVAENICRFQNVDSEAVISAAKGLEHELVLKLPQGYDTNIGWATIVIWRAKAKNCVGQSDLYGPKGHRSR